jgi:hypothetical protein
MNYQFREKTQTCIAQDGSYPRKRARPVSTCGNVIFKPAVESNALSLCRNAAASLCGISVHTFDVWVRKGILPGPIPGTRRWSRASIEASLSRGEKAANPDSSPFQIWKNRDAD